MSVYSHKTKKGIVWHFQRMINRKFYRGGGYPTKRAAINAERSVSPNRSMAFGEVCDQYLTWIEERRQSKAWIYEKRLFIKKHLSKWFEIPFEDISPLDIELHMHNRAAVVSNFAANKDLKFIKAIFSFGVHREYRDDNPASRVSTMPTEEHSKYIPPMDDFVKVYMAALPLEKRLLAMLFCTAGRINELLNLKWDDVSDTHLILRSRKHRDGQLRERRIPLNSVMREALNFLSGAGPRGEYVFTNEREDTRFLRRPKLMHRLCKKAGVKHFGFHSIRHLATSALMQQGEPIGVLKDLLGHAKITTTQIYIHSLEDSLGVATEKLGEIIIKKSLNVQNYQ